MDNNIEKNENNNERKINDKTLMAFSVALSQVNAVKPLVEDNMYRAIENLNSGLSVFETAKKFEDDINEDLKFQFVIDKLKPIYESFLSHISDKQNYQFMSIYEADDVYEEMDYDNTWGDDFRKRKLDEEEKIKNSFAKCNQEMKQILTKTGFVNDKDLDEVSNKFVNKFFTSQSRAEDFYNFCSKIYEQNKNSDVLNGKAPEFVANSKVTKTIDQLNKIVNSALIKKLMSTNYCGTISEQEKSSFNTLVTEFATSDGFVEMFKDENLRGEIKDNLPSASKMLDVLIENDGNLGSVYEKQAKDLSNIAKTLYYERVLSLIYLQNEKFGKNSLPVKVYIDKDENGNEVKKAIFEKGDLLHIANVKDGHLESIKQDNCLKAKSLLENFKSNFFGDAKYGGVHFLEIPVNYNSFDDKCFKDRHNNLDVNYYYSFAKENYNSSSKKLGFVIDGNVKDEMAKFDLMHSMDNLVVDSRIREISSQSSNNSQNYYSASAGLMNEAERLERDKCYLLGMPLTYTRAITMYNGSWGKVEESNVNKVLNEFGDEVPVVVNGILVNNPSPSKIEIVDKNYLNENAIIKNTEGR